jgi:hypothetical protein
VQTPAGPLQIPVQPRVTEPAAQTQPSNSSNLAVRQLQDIRMVGAPVSAAPVAPSVQQNAPSAQSIAAAVAPPSQPSGSIVLPPARRDAVIGQAPSIPATGQSVSPALASGNRVAQVSAPVRAPTSVPVVGGVQQAFNAAASVFRPQPTPRSITASSSSYAYGPSYPPATTFNPYARTATASASYLPPPYPPAYPPGYSPGYTLPNISTYNPFLGSYPYLPPYPYAQSSNPNTPTQYAYVGGALRSSSQHGYFPPVPASVTSYALPNAFGPSVDIYGSRYPYASVYVNGVWYKPWEVPSQLGGGYGRSYYNPYDTSYLHAATTPGFGYRNLYLPGIDSYGSRYPYASAHVPPYPPAYPPGYSPGYTLPNISTYNPYQGSYGSIPPYPVAGTYPFGQTYSANAPTQYTYVGGVLHSSSQHSPTIPVPAAVPSYALPNAFGPSVDIYGSRYPYGSVYLNGVWYKPWEVPSQLGGGYGRSYYNPYDTSYLHTATTPGFGYRSVHLPGVDIYGSTYPYASVYINGVWYKPWEVPGNTGYSSYSYNPYVDPAAYVAPYDPYRMSYPYGGAFNPYRSSYPYTSSYPYNSGYDPYASGYLHTFSDTSNGLRLPVLTRSLGFRQPQPSAAAFALPTFLANGGPQRLQARAFGHLSQMQLPGLGSFRLPAGIAAALPPAFGFDPFGQQPPSRTDFARSPFGVESPVAQTLPPTAPAPFSAQVTGQPAAAAPAIAQPAASANPMPMAAGFLGAGLFEPAPAFAAPSGAAAGIELAESWTPSMELPAASPSAGDLTIAAAPRVAQPVVPIQQARSLASGPLLPSDASALSMEAAPGPIDGAPEIAMLPPQAEVPAIVAAAPAVVPVEVPASSVAVLDPNAARSSVAVAPATSGPAGATGGSPVGPPLVAVLAVLTGLGMWGLSFLRRR